MKRIWIALFIGISIIFICTATYAGPPTIIERIENQQRRIDEGVINGQLTIKEARILQDNLNWIRTEALRMKRDHILTPLERKRLHRLLDRNSEMIYRKKHNPVIRLYP